MLYIYILYIYISLGINHIGDITTFWGCFLIKSRISTWLSKAVFWDLMGIYGKMWLVYGMQSGNTGCLWNGYIYILIYISWSLYIGVRFLPKWDSLRCVYEFLMNVRCPFFSHLFGTPFPAMASLMEKRWLTTATSPDPLRPSLDSPTSAASPVNERGPSRVSEPSMETMGMAATNRWQWMNKSTSSRGLLVVGDASGWLAHAMISDSWIGD